MVQKTLYRLLTFLTLATAVLLSETALASPLLSQAVPAVSSSQEGGFAAANATDGNTTSTRWSSNRNDAEWIYVDLGSNSNGVTIDRVVLYWQSAYGKAYQIQTSNDALNWTTIYSTSTGDGHIDDLSVSGSGRYVRMNGVKRGTGYGYSLYEFQVYGQRVTASLSATTSKSSSSVVATSTSSIKPSSSSVATTSVSSSIKSSSSSAAPVCSTLPSIPTGLNTSAVTSTSLTLSWIASTPGANCTITGYRVFKNAVQTTTATTTNTSISGLSAGTTYTFNVSAVNEFGVSAQSATLSVATLFVKSPKRGLAYDLVSANDFAALSPGVSWWYNWGSQPNVNAPVDYRTQYNMDFVPMLWGKSFNATTIENYLQAHSSVKYILVLNEPNLVDQANVSPQEAAALWPQYEAIAAHTGVKIVGPAMTWGTMTNYWDPVVWLDAFYAAYRNANNNRDPQIDYLAFHWYDYGLAGQLDRLTKYGKPFWVTEFANWHNKQDGAQIDTLAKQITQMTDMVAVCENRSDVFRYSWFIGRWNPDPHFTSLLGADGQLTDLGKKYINLPFKQ